MLRQRMNRGVSDECSLLLPRRERSHGVRTITQPWYPCLSHAHASVRYIKEHSRVLTGMPIIFLHSDYHSCIPCLASPSLGYLTSSFIHNVIFLASLIRLLTIRCNYLVSHCHNPWPGYLVCTTHDTLYMYYLFLTFKTLDFMKSRI